MTRLSYDPLRPLALALWRDSFSGSPRVLLFRGSIAIVTFALAGFVMFRSQQTGDMRPFFAVVAVYWAYAIFAVVLVIRKRASVKVEEPFDLEQKQQHLDSVIEKPAGLSGIFNWHDRLFAKIGGSRIRLLFLRLVAIIVGWTALIAVGYLAYEMKDLAYFGWGALVVGFFAALAHKVLEFRTSELSHLDGATAKRRVKWGKIANISAIVILLVTISAGVQFFMSLWVLLVPLVMMSLFQIVPVVLHFIVTKPEA